VVRSLGCRRVSGPCFLCALALCVLVYLAGVTRFSRVDNMQQEMEGFWRNTLTSAGRVSACTMAVSINLSGVYGFCFARDLPHPHIIPLCFGHWPEQEWNVHCTLW